MNESPRVVRSIPTYGFAGYRASSFAHAVGWPGLAVTFVSFFVLGIFGEAGYLAVAAFVVSVDLWALSRVHSNPTRDPEGIRTGSGKRTDRIASGMLWAGLLLVAVACASIAANDAEFRVAHLVARPLATVALPLNIAAISTALRRERLVEMATETVVWSLEDDDGYLWRRCLARCIDLVLVGVGGSFLVLTDWWSRYVPNLGIEGGREFLGALLVLVVYECFWGYARGSIGKRACGLRLRSVPGIRGFRAAIWPVSRATAFLATGAAVWLATFLTERTGSTEAQTLMAMVILPLPMMLLVHPEAQAVYDAAAGCRVTRKRERVPATLAKI
ncbi:hypothetical protein [Candidatus Poriferisodalis sp.]|uniref:hypothetical protein n=1 Tax=Candidatus Poriferisodalis sp. TaxID=3101277 RepID=UPI003B52368C